MISQIWNRFRDSIFLLGILTFSLPLKTPVIQLYLENAFGFSFPIQLSTNTLFLPMWLGITVVVNMLRLPRVLGQLKFPLFLMAALFFWMWLGAWFSEWRGHSLKHAGRYTIYFLVFLTLLILVRAQNIRSMTSVLLGWFLFISGLTLAEQLFADWRLQPWFASIGLRLDLHYPPETSRLSSIFENPNPYGLISASLLGIAVYGLSQKLWVLGSLSTCAAIWGVIESGSRNAALILFFVSILILAPQIIREVIYGRNCLKSLIGAIITITALYLITFSFSPRVHERSQEILVKLKHVSELEHFEEIDPRFALFRMAIEYGIENPSFLGVGVKSFGYAVSEKASGPVALAFQNANEAWNAHNALLTIWIEMGWIGLLFALGFILTWFWQHRSTSVLLWASILILSLGQIFDYFIWQITFMTLQSLVFTLMAVSAEQNSAKHHRSKI